MIASLLLGVSPPRLSSRHLVEAGALFGISEGTVRVALSRMTHAGELDKADGHYELAGQLLERYERQQQSRAPAVETWSGDWSMQVVGAAPRDADARADLRDAARTLRYGELREGVWMRPDNLDPGRNPDASKVVGSQCHTLIARPANPENVATELWDLSAWNSTAVALRADMAPLVPRLRAGDPASLAPAFEVAAAVVRHLLADPLLPGDLVPPDWSGPALRADYDEYEAAFKALWRDFFAVVPRSNG